MTRESKLYEKMLPSGFGLFHLGRRYSIPIRKWVILVLFCGVIVPVVQYSGRRLKETAGFGLVGWSRGWHRPRGEVRLDA